MTPELGAEITEEFQAFPKLARLNRDIVVTEKIDGTNAAVGVTSEGRVFAQSRKRLISPGADNFGFAAFVERNREAFEMLGPGYYYGEWWGSGIQRGYGLENGEKRFSFFNPSLNLAPEIRSIPEVDVVPVLYEGPFSQNAIKACVIALEVNGSMAAPGYDKPEGVVVFHEAARQSFKVAIEGDGEPKSVREARLAAEAVQS